MSGFVIYAIILTVIYLIYYTVFITLELGMKKESKNEDEESFDVSEMAAEVEEPIAIAERQENSENVGMTYTDHIDDDGLRVIAPSGNITPEVAPHELPSQEEPTSKPTTTSAMLHEEHEAYMEQIDADYQLSYFADEFIDHLNKKHNQRKIEKKNVIDHL